MIDDETPFTTPEELAKRIGCSTRHIKVLIRAIGAGRQFGQKIVLLPEDVDLILEAVKIPPRHYGIRILDEVYQRRRDEQHDPWLEILRKQIAEDKRKKDLERLPPNQRHSLGDPDLRPGENLRQMRARLARERREKLAQKKREEAAKTKSPKPRSR